MQLYTIDPQYCNFLRQYDKLVPYNDLNKQNRPFVGIVFSVNDSCYYAPLSSPKPKHQSMKNQIDFIKIDNGILGAINLNNMIPVPGESLVKKSYLLLKTDTVDVIKYKNLLVDQISWCNKNKEYIITKAEKLYKTITENRAFGNLQERCCDFKLLEDKCREYCIIKGYEKPVKSPPKQISGELRYKEISLEQESVLKKIGIQYQATLSKGNPNKLIVRYNAEDESKISDALKNNFVCR